MTSFLSRDIPQRTEPVGARVSLAVADANWFSTENLFSELDHPAVSTLLLNCVDYLNAGRAGRPPWTWGSRLTQLGPALWRKDHVLPSGWMKRYPTWGMRPIGRSIDEWRRQGRPDDELALITTYPHYIHLRDLVHPDRYIYFNLDDYALYWPRRATDVRELERRAVREADLTVCVSALRCEQLRSLVPEAASRIKYLPHGTPKSVLGRMPALTPDPPPADLAQYDGPRLGYIGSLEDRIDWPLLTRLADAFPDATIILIGRLRVGGKAEWMADCRRCLSRPNVHHLGWRDQGELSRYSRAFDVCLIPYRADHPFNISCSPTKIGDYLGTGRPIVSTALPECRIYGELFDVVETHEAFLAAVSRSLKEEDRQRWLGQRRFEWAQLHTCRRMADRLLDWLGL